MKLNISGKITQYFINSQLTVLLMAATAILGLFALIYTPREENPQIVVPAANVMVAMPGSSAKEVEELVSKRLESILWEIPGVEDVYSVSMNSMSVVTVKFFVGQDKERSMVKLYDKLITQALSTTVIKRTSFSNIESSSRMEPDCHLAALGAIRNSGMSARGIALTAPLSNSSSRRMLSSAQAS